MDNRSSTRNSCSCIKCVSQNCSACQHQEASYCTCDKLGHSIIICSQDKLTLVCTDCNVAPENKQIKRDETNISKQECKKPTTDCQKTCPNNVNVPKTKVCPVFCPTCHKIFIDEKNEEHSSDKDMIILNECPKCQKAPPKTQENRPLKCSDLKEMNKCQAKNRPIPKSFKNSKKSQFCCPRSSHKQDQPTTKVCCPEIKTTGQQTEERPPPAPKSFWAWLMELLGLSKPEVNIDNAVTDTKSPTPKCSKCKEVKIDSQPIDERICPKLCEKFKEINLCCPELVQKRKPEQVQKQAPTKVPQKCRTECGVCSCSQTEDKKQGAVSCDNLSSEQKDSIMIWIKECVHKELEDVRKPGNNESKEINSKTSSIDKCQPSKHCESKSCAFYEKVKDYIKEKKSGPIKAYTDAAKKVKNESKKMEHKEEAGCDKTNKTSEGEFSAEIMNVPYTKYKQSICKKTDINDKTCSCKVPDSVSKGPTTKEDCNCSIVIDNTKVPLSADSNKCEEEKNKCVESIKTSCACNPCECIKCDNLKEKHKKTSFIVAPMTSIRESHQQSYCQCSPCECIECVHSFGTFAQTFFTQETSTDERHRHNNCGCNHCDNNKCEEQEQCSCERHSTFTGKPVTGNTNEYGIHYYINEKPHENIYKKKRSPITIYTSLTHHYLYYPKTRTSRDSAYSSLSSRSTSVSIIPQHYWALRANAHLISNSVKQCDCKPCECLKCKKHYLEGHIPYRQCNCSCEICDCINCATLNIYYEIEKKCQEKSKTSETQQMCNCLPCHCKHCLRYINGYINEYGNSNCDPVISPTESDHLLSLAKVSDSERFIDCVLSNKESKNRTAIINKSCLSKKTTPMSINDSSQKNKYHVYCNRGICIKPGTKYNKSFDQQDSKLSYQVQSRENKDIHTTENSSQISDQTEENDSTISSSMTPLPYAHINEPVSKEQINSKPIRSSCNSSGYDHSDYLIRFPTSKVVTYIKDIDDNKLDKDYLKPPTSKPVKDCSESSINTLHYQKELSIPVQQSFNTIQLDDICKTCKSRNSDKSCDCYPCACDKCYYKMPKLKRCRCDCASCRCDGTCLSEDRSILIRKNETTQTTVFAPDCGEVITKKLSSLKLKKSIVTFSEKDKIVKWTDFPMSKLTYSTKCYTNYNLPIINYDSVQRTIREAKQFSLELLSILEKYEKANRDFDIMSQRYKSLHKSILCEDIDQKQLSEQPNNFQIAFINTLPTYQNNTSVEKSKINFEDSNLETSKLSTYVTGIHNTASEKDEQIKLQESDARLDDRNTVQDNNITSSLNKDVGIPSLENGKYNNQDNINQTESTFNDDHSQLNKINVINTASHANSVGKSDLEKLKQEYKKYSQHLEEAINKRRQTVWVNQKVETKIENRVKENFTNKYSTTTSKLNGFSYQIPPIKEFINKQNSGDLNTVFICQSQKYHESYRNNEIFPKILNFDQLDSLKKFEVPDKKETDIDGSLKADHDIEQLSCTARYLQSQGRQAFSRSKSSTRMASRRFELSPSGIRSVIIDTNAIKICNSLKVTFQMIRKVSDHSILLKWKIPDDTKNIEGYKIQVDGRSIQRILNPTRNMAVLTCLPHVDKVQITVRTITKMADGLTPCATISYCNRF